MLVEPRVTLYIQIHDKRPREQKLALAQSLTEACVQGIEGIKPDHVSITFRVLNYDDMTVGPELLTDVLRKGKQ